MIAVFEGDAARAAALARAGAALDADARDRCCLAMLAYFLTTSDHGDEAMASVKHAISRVGAAGVPSASIVRWSEGKAFAGREIARALAASEQAAEIARRSGNLFWEILSRLEMAALRARGGDPVAALHDFSRLLDDWRHSRDLMVLSHGLGALVVLFECLTMPEPAAILNGALTWANQASPFVPELSEVVRRLVEHLGQEAFEYATASGVAMTPREGNDYAIAQIDAALATIALS
jgi:ATP/maltotriose-dependent transcriptional regulator MalT